MKLTEFLLGFVIGTAAMVCTAFFLYFDSSARELYAACSKIDTRALFKFMEDDYINLDPRMTALLNGCYAIRFDRENPTIEK